MITFLAANPYKLSFATGNDAWKPFAFYFWEGVTFKGQALNG